MRECCGPPTPRLVTCLQSIGAECTFRPVVLVGIRSEARIA